MLPRKSFVHVFRGWEAPDSLGRAAFVQPLRNFRISAVAVHHVSVRVTALAMLFPAKLASKGRREARTSTAPGMSEVQRVLAGELLRGREDLLLSSVGLVQAAPYSLESPLPVGRPGGP